MSKARRIAYEIAADFIAGRAEYVDDTEVVVELLRIAAAFNEAAKAMLESEKRVLP